MSKIVKNEEAYKPTPMFGNAQVFELKVVAIIDAVPGAWHNPEDLMNWIAKHSYVQSVELTTPPPMYKE